ncbi:STAS domain-containing protein [Dactylosporangium roseum]|uniref:STAS domain-containing protein n=1 Tax=Dactylosporangium roseum TaxID=47989 RepID=A0ABY5YXL5_9ACTN|nr:STAS domain-containing protein [Dactylosporangium roseum]UWZ34277.1 STAS domain-containing protein [Dactylosporangium roseum]
MEVLWDAGDMALSFEVYRHAAGQVLLRLRGELDQDTAATFHQALATALETVPSELLLDLSMVTAVGVSGISVLMAARRAADQLRCRFGLSAVSPAVDRQLRSRGLTSPSLEPGGR